MDVKGAWKNPEIRLEHGGSTSREGPGALTQRPPRSGCSPLPHPPPPPPGCPLKPGGGFDLGSARLSAGRPGALGEGRGGADHPPPGLTLPRPPAPRPPGQGDCFRLLQEGTRAPRLHALQLFPSCPAPPQRQLGERLRAGSGAQLLGSGAGTGEGGDMKEPGPAGVAGEGSPQAVDSLRAPHIWPTGAVSGEGETRSAPDHPALPGMGRSDRLPGGRGR